jgi:hypothetical protein
MSMWMGQARAQVRTRLPRLAENAVERARLTLVPRGRTRAKRMPFLVLVSFVLLAGVIGLLVVNTQMQQVSFKPTALEAQAASLRAEKQGLQMELDKLRDPQRVALAAEHLGMVPISHPAFLKLADGSVLGDALPVNPLDRQRITPLPTRAPAGYNPPPRVEIVKPPADGAPSQGRGSDGGTKNNRTQQDQTTTR